MKEMITTQRIKSPLSSLQAAALASLPREWASIDNTRVFSHQFSVLVAKGLAERRKVGDSYQWRRVTQTFDQAVQQLVDLLPSSDKGLKSYPAREELLEVRRQLDVRAEAQRALMPCGEGVRA